MFHAGRFARSGRRRSPPAFISPCHFAAASLLSFVLASATKTLDSTSTTARANDDYSWNFRAFGKTLLTLSASSTNVALNRPCSPTPYCSLLVDGSNVSAAWAGNGLESSLRAAASDAFASGSAFARVFRVYLEGRVFIKQVVVICRPVRGGNYSAGGPLGGRRLVVTTWLGGDNASPEISSGKEDRGHAVPQLGYVKEETDVKIKEKDMESGAAIPVEVPIQRFGVSVSVAWSDEGGEGRREDDVGVVILITEVLVQSQPEEETADTDVSSGADSMGAVYRRAMAQIQTVSTAGSAASPASSSRGSISARGKLRASGSEVDEVTGSSDAFSTSPLSYTYLTTVSPHKPEVVDELVEVETVVSSSSEGDGVRPVVDFDGEAYAVTTEPPRAAVKDAATQTIAELKNEVAAMENSWFVRSGSSPGQSAWKALASQVPERLSSPYTAWKELGSYAERFPSPAALAGEYRAREADAEEKRARSSEDSSRRRALQMLSKAPRQETFAPLPSPPDSSFGRAAAAGGLGLLEGAEGALESGFLRSSNADLHAATGAAAAADTMGKMHILAGVSLTLISVLMIFSQCRWCCRCKASSFEPSYDLMMQDLQDAEAAMPVGNSSWLGLSDEEGSTGAPSAAVPAGAETFFIGSPALSRTSSPPLSRSSSISPPVTPRRLASLARSSSTPLRHGSSESEPEGELDPASGGSTPRGSAAAATAPDPSAGAIASSILAKYRTEASGEADASETTALLAAPEVQITPPANGQVMLLYASPLCFLDSSQQPVAIPGLPLEKEGDVIVRAYDEASVALRSRQHRAGRRGTLLRPGATLQAQLLTSGSLQRAIAPVAASSAATVLQLSAHGSQGCLVMEDGRGCTAHLLSFEMLKGMLGLRVRHGGNPRLVILNACNLRRVGELFVEGGIPHVIGSSADVRDSASQVFLCMLYSQLFQGNNVAQSFHAAKVALRTSSQPSARALAESVFLLPEGNDAVHDEVLFRPVSSGSASDRVSRSPTAFSRNTARSSLSSSTTAGSSGGGSSGFSTSADASAASSDPEEDFGSDNNAADTSSGAASCEATSSDSDRDTGQVSARGARLVPPFSARSSASLSTTLARRPGGRGGLDGTGSQRSLASWRSEPVAPAMRFVLCGQPVPSLPEDFLGRTLDVWTVVQHLNARRAVVVCGANGMTHGIGKSAVLDAVHRTSALQMGALCVPVALQSLRQVDVSAAAAVGGWIDKVKAAVQAAIRREQQRDHTAGSRSSTRCGGLQSFSLSRSRRCTGAFQHRRGRGGGARSLADVRQGFHPLSDPLAVAHPLQELIADLSYLEELCEARSRWQANAGSQVLLLLDECDHLIQQQNFQLALADILQQCAQCRVVLSTQQPMVGTAGGHFKVVHHALNGLAAPDAARLFLRRAHRPLRWAELIVPNGLGSDNAAAVSAAMQLGQPAGSGATAAAAPASSLQSQVGMNKANEAAVLALVAQHPVIAAKRGNPRGLIELASQLAPALGSLADLGKEVLTQHKPPQAAMASPAPAEEPEAAV
eukprot:TRINITY_DN59497_c0_g1_i1.p1 TRINITY_DN59497_c0_g1~~TRINITY_DN59497_c0_g1_i1.p1  ORF type:complete len:1530 (-),score=326.76 TRINITY_DN59497_c0_g1_i1:114-4703(-)